MAEVKGKEEVKKDVDETTKAVEVISIQTETLNVLREIRDLLKTRQATAMDPQTAKGAKVYAPKEKEKKQVTKVLKPKK
jgi:hypothetical protein